MTYISFIKFSERRGEFYSLRHPRPEITAETLEDAEKAQTALSYKTIRALFELAPMTAVMGAKAKRYYSMTLETTPAPTVRPPSRIANLRPSSIAMGVMSEISILMLSPGMTISTPSGSLMVPVTSVVLK